MKEHVLRMKKESFGYRYSVEQWKDYKSKKMDKIWSSIAEFQLER